MRVTKNYLSLLFGLLTVLLVVLAFFDVSFAQAALVKCGNGDTGDIKDACTFTDFFNTAVELINYLLSGVAVAAVGGVVWGGWLMATSNGSDSKVKSGKTAVTNSVIGLSIVLAAFLMVRSVFVILGFQGGDAPITNPGGFTNSGSGFQLFNPGPGNGASVTPTPSGDGTAPAAPAPSGSNQELAQKVLQTLGEQCFYDFHVSGQGKGDGATAIDNIRDAANGRPVKTSQYGEAKGRTTTIDNRVLQAMLAIHSQYKSICRISEIAGGDHAEYSAHYNGKAFDMENTLNAAGILAICKQYGAYLTINHGSSSLHCGWQ